jgi:hypothetical protein
MANVRKLNLPKSKAWPNGEVNVSMKNLKREIEAFYSHAQHYPLRTDKAHD